MAYTTINKPSAHFNTKLYAGNSGTQSISGVGHQPDLVWVKQRNGSAYHQLTDVIRGVNSQAAANAVGLGASNTCLTAFNSDGFALGSNGDVNASNKNYVSWNWKANGSGSSNTNGSINTIKTSANTTSGFSISTFTGTGSNATVGHGLGVAPKMVIVKSYSAGEDWTIYHSALGGTKYIVLNSTGVAGTNVGAFNNTSPTSSVFYVGTFGATNGSSQTLVAYSFAEKQGFSKIGSYKGNGNADGAFVYTGFKPAFILIKNTENGARNWQIYDNKRIGYNYNNYRMAVNLPQTEESNLNLDIYSNGFKTLSTDADVNENAKKYIYMAFAEEPLVGTNNVAATAR